MTHHDKVDAADASQSTIEYWSCDSCNKNYADQNGETALDSIYVTDPEAPDDDPSKPIDGNDDEGDDKGDDKTDDKTDDKGDDKTDDKTDDKIDNKTDGKDEGGLPVGAVIGIVASGVVVIAIAAFAIVWFVVKKKTFADIAAIFKKK